MGRRKVTYNDESVVPACLPIGSPDLEILGIPNFEEGTNGIRAHAVGWGKTQLRSLDTFSSIDTETGSTATTDILRQVDLPILSSSQCARSYPEASRRYNKQVCAGGEEGKDSCKG